TTSMGSYAVNSSANCVAGTAKFSLTNLFGPASLVVTTLSDQDNAINTNSLRHAIANAETQSAPQTIIFPKSILPKASGNFLDLLCALPDLTANTAIQGPGAQVLSVQRDPSASAFRIFAVDAGATAAVSGLTISGGSAAYGGGIYNAGSLTVSNSN